ncbi:MAG: T9SS type A sorting domain-containing protein, partial [Ignavibacteria bacterium]|nr:T9SS type A sorting domain-containing protein [Ignavibacteria bacterium]
GQRFNGTVNGLPQNTSVPQEVADALFNFSDHLPVTLQLEVSKLLDLNERLSRPFLAEISPNPAVNEAQLKFYMPVAENLKIEIIAVNGKQMYAIKQFFGSGKKELLVNLTEFPSGFYFVRLIGTNNRSETLKLVRIP